MNNTFLKILFNYVYCLTIITAIYIPYGQLECDIFNSFYQIDNINGFSYWKNNGRGNNDNEENDVYSDIINKLYNECFIKQFYKNVRYEKNFNEIFEKGNIINIISSVKFIFLKFLLQ